jgi:hypothetical protein
MAQDTVSSAFPVTMWGLARWWARPQCVVVSGVPSYHLGCAILLQQFSLPPYQWGSFLWLSQQTTPKLVALNNINLFCPSSGQKPTVKHGQAKLPPEPLGEPGPELIQLCWLQLLLLVWRLLLQSPLPGSHGYLRACVCVSRFPSPFS